MLLTFKGKGCENCPFMRTVTVYDYNIIKKETMLCGLNRRKLADGNILPLLYPDGITKPKDCPFVQYPNTLEIAAHNE